MVSTRTIGDVMAELKAENERLKREKREKFSVECKLGSLIVHLEEYLESGHDYDLIAARQMQDDSEVVAWREEMDRQGLLPKKRSA